MIPAVTSFLSSTFEDSVKKLLQPAGLVPAAVLLLLNVLFVLPPLHARREPLSEALYGLQPDAWQVILAIVFVLAVGYLLASFNDGLTGLLAGDIWGKFTPFGWFGIWMQTLRLKGLQERLSKLKSGKEYDETRLYLDTNLPIEIPLRPTALGNVLNAMAQRVWTRYSMDVSVLWPYLETCLTADKVLAERIGNSKAQLDLFVNLVFVLFVAAVEIALVEFWLVQLPPELLTNTFWSEHGAAGLVILLLVISAFLVYRAAVSKAASWGGEIQVAFDLHHEDLRKALGVREFKPRETAKGAWENISRWLLYGTNREEYYRLLDEPKTTSDDIQLDAPPMLQVKSESAIIMELSSLSQPESCVHATEEFKYILWLTHPQDKEQKNYAPPLTRAFVQFSDERIKLIAQAPTLENASEWGNNIPTAELLAPEFKKDPKDAPKLIWKIPYLAANGMGRLVFKLPRRQLQICVEAMRPNNATLRLAWDETALIATKDRTYSVILSNIGSISVSDISIRVTDEFIDAITPLALLVRTPQETLDDLGTKAANVRRWQVPLNQFAAGQDLRFIFSSTAKSKEDQNV